MDTSLQAYYDQAMQQLKSGKYADVKMVSIDGIDLASSSPRLRPRARTTFVGISGSATAAILARCSSSM